MQSFPWTLSLIDFHCYTLQQRIQKNFIKKVTLNAIIALTTKTAATELNTLTALSVCVHIDNSSIIISLSEDQVLIKIFITMLFISYAMKEYKFQYTFCVFLGYFYEQYSFKYYKNITNFMRLPERQCNCITDEQRNASYSSRYTSNSVHSDSNNVSRRYYQFDYVYIKR